MSDGWYRVNCAKLWAKVVLFQGGRLFDAHNAAMAELDEMRLPPRERPRPTAPTVTSRERTTAEEYFFVTALRQAERWLQVAVGADPALQSSHDQFRQRVPGFKEVRDMREHEDAYLDGIGRQQAAYECTTKIGEMTASVDASSTVVVGDRYLIGGRLDVRQAVEAVAAVLPALEAAEARQP